MRVRKVSAFRFERAISVAASDQRHGRRVSETLTRYTFEEYAQMRCFLTEDALSGFAIKDDGDLVSVFNVGRRGLGDDLVKAAVYRGATKLDAFDEDGFLPSLYARHGFVEVGRDEWNDKYRPVGWAGARPDVVYMVLAR